MQNTSHRWNMTRSTPTGARVIRALIDRMESLDKEHQPLCITGTLGIRAAVGTFSTKVFDADLQTVRNG